MLRIDEYKELKKRDLQYAKEIVEKINSDPRPGVKHKESRPITDVKHMLETSAELFGDNVAVYQKFIKGGEYEKITYKEMLYKVNALGTALINEGYKDRRIAVIGDNCSQWAVSYLAVLCGVGVVVPLDKELNSSELEQLIVQAEVSCVIFKGEKLEKLFKNMVAGGETIIKKLVRMDAIQDVKEVTALETLIEEGCDLLDKGDTRYTKAQIFAEDMSILLFTSGTTGVSKGVMLSHRNIAVDLMVSPTVLKVNDWDIFFSILPLHHTYECTCGFLMPMYKGAAIAYCEGLKYITKNLEEVKPTMFLGVPVLFETLYKKIWKNVQNQGKEKMLRNVIKINRKTKKIGIDLGNIFFKDIRNVFGGRMRMMICGGAAINPEVLEGIRNFGINALQGYGLTECAPMGALNPDSAPKATSIGIPFPACEMKIEDANEEGVGEIYLKGGNVMLGYYNMPVATEEVLQEGWFKTGDLGYIDDEGNVIITGRKKNVIITKNGKNVYPEELEYYLSNIPIISESMIFSEEAEKGMDDLIVAAIKLDDEEVENALGKEVDEEAIKKVVWQEVDKINEEQPFFKRIKKIVIKKEDFVKNTSKKIIRFAEGNKE